ncbi:MAG TPA: BatA domain-containing protein [Vicinamibacterales bacterium]|nr:BatA domain-containing protein [Vicinamibacterales bacterium]
MTIAFAAAAVALAAYLFFRKLRPARVAVPSLLLWSRVLADPRQVTLWDRIRRAVSLIVTCAIAAALAFAIGDPRRTGSPSEGDGTRTLVVLDASLSMLARTTGGTRWERALGEARRIAAAAGGEVAVATTSDGIIEGPTADRALIDAALDRLAPGGAAGAWPELEDAHAVHFITDGTAAPPADQTVTVHSVYQAASNVAITAFDVRQGDAGQTEIYLEATNFGPRTDARISVRRGEATILQRSVAIEDGQSVRHLIPIATAGAPRLTARVDAGDDALPIDDEASAWIAAADPIAVTVVGAQTTWLAKLLTQSPNVKPAFVSPADYKPSGENVVIFDEWAPPALPPVPALLFHPPATDAEDPQWIAVGTHPVLRGVDPLTLSIARAAQYGADGLTPIAASTRELPLISVRDRIDASRMVVVAFGARGSNLADAPAFPVLIGNALDWLSAHDDAAARRPGLALFDPSVERVTDPNGTPLPLVRFPAETVATLRTPGFYSVERRGSRSTFAVNAGDPRLSNLRQAPAGQAAQASLAAAALRSRPWWIYLAGLAFAAALVEWWTWLRRITV